MATLSEFRKKAKKLTKTNYSKALFDAIRLYEVEILKLNESQLQGSKTANNKALFSSKTGRGVYSKATEIISGGKKKEGDPYTLFDTGDFYSGFFLNVSNSKARFGSTDSKAKDLVLEFGDIFGLTDDNLKAVIDDKLLPFLIQFTRKTLDI